MDVYTAWIRAANLNDKSFNLPPVHPLEIGFGAVAEAMMAITTMTVTMTIEQFFVGRTHGTGRLRVHQSANGSAQNQQ